MKYSILLAALTSAVFTGAHSIVDEIRAGDVDYPGYNPYHDPEKNPVPKRIVWAFPTAMNGPTTDLTLPDIACNKGAQPALLVAPAKAGSKVRFHWQPWPENHKGPIMTYMANCNGDCKNADPTKLDFFKIDEAGLYPSGEWATMDFIHNKNTTWTVTIPSDIVAGNYLIRQELVSLHSADQAGRAQFYPMCANLEISGTGTARPAGVRFPGAYKATDPGILVDIAKIKTYQIPGPPVYVPGSAPASAPVDSPVDKPAQPVYSHNNATTPTTP
ncbi:glycoside hydrolase, partial [Wilcoxina mikolae CBS 423.85]